MVRGAPRWERGKARKRRTFFTFNHSRRIKGRVNYYLCSFFTSVHRLPLPVELLSFSASPVLSQSRDLSDDNSQLSVTLISSLSWSLHLLSLLSRSSPFSSRGIFPLLSLPIFIYTHLHTVYVCDTYVYVGPFVNWFVYTVYVDGLVFIIWSSGVCYFSYCFPHRCASPRPQQNFAPRYASCPWQLCSIKLFQN